MIVAALILSLLCGGQVATPSGDAPTAPPALSFGPVLGVFANFPRVPEGTPAPVAFGLQLGLRVGRLAALETDFLGYGGAFVVDMRFPRGASSVFTPTFRVEGYLQRPSPLLLPDLHGYLLLGAPISSQGLGFRVGGGAGVNLFGLVFSDFSRDREPSHDRNAEVLRWLLLPLSLTRLELHYERFFLGSSSEAAHFVVGFGL